MVSRIFPDYGEQAPPALAAKDRRAFFKGVARRSGRPESSWRSSFLSRPKERNWSQNTQKAMESSVEKLAPRVIPDITPSLAGRRVRDLLPRMSNSFRIRNV